MTTELRHLLRWIETNADTLDIATESHYATVVIDGVHHVFDRDGGYMLDVRTEVGASTARTVVPTTWLDRRIIAHFVRRMHRAQLRADRAHVAGRLRGIVTGEKP